MPFRRLCGLVVIAGLAACANLSPTESGFLDDYSALRPSKANPRDPSYRKPGLAAETYTSFLLDPVVYQPAAVLTAETDTATIDELLADYRAKLEGAFATRFTKVTEPGPGVLRIRAAVTGLERANPVLNGVTMAIILVPVTAGGASTEAEVLDSVTGERLVALQGFNNGGKSFLGGPVGYLSRYGQARRSFTRQAEQLRDTLVRAPAP